MTFSIHTLTLSLTGVILLGALAPCEAVEVRAGEGKDRQIRQLKLQLQKSQAQYLTLARDLAASKKRESATRKSLNDLRLRFAALGDNLLNGSQADILEAVKNAEVLDKRYRRTETAAIKLIADVREYLRTAIASDPDSRVHLETSLRELDVALGLRQNPRSHIAQGSLQYAKIVSIDAKSGLLVINAGEDQTVKIGMTFSIMRGTQKVAEAIVAGIHKNFSGLLPTDLKNSQDAIRLGDIASIKTTQR